jgi:hypothetical protein
MAASRSTGRWVVYCVTFTASNAATNLSVGKLLAVEIRGRLSEGRGLCIFPGVLGWFGQRRSNEE